jgi:Ca2+-binding EF-hand superfamily protein
VLIFEVLDEGRTGMISARNFRQFLHLAHRLKHAKGSPASFLNETSLSQQTEVMLDQAQSEIRKVIEQFNLDGDRLLSPIEFYEIIAAFYE